MSAIDLEQTTAALMGWGLNLGKAVAVFLIGRFIATLPILALALSLALAPVLQAQVDWQPEAESAEDFDWIKLVSGEWLKGELSGMVDDKVDFDSDKLDVQSLDWADVVEVRTSHIMQVRLVDNTTATGKLVVNGDSVRVIAEQKREFSKSQILMILAGEPEEINYWAMKIGLGANLRSGNTDQTEANANLSISRQTVNNRIRFDYLGIYNTTSDIETANNHRATLGWDKFITHRFYVVPVFGEIFRDPFQNISSKWTLGGGVGYTLIDTPKTGWDLFIGPGYQETRFVDVLDDEESSESTPALIVGTTLEQEISKLVDFDFQYRFQIVNEPSGQYNHHLLAGLEFELTSRLDFDFTFVWDRIQKPRPDSEEIVPEQDDYRLIFGISLDL